MKKLVYISALLLVCIFTLVSCEREQFSEKDNSKTETVAEGQLNLSSLKLTVDVNANTRSVDTKDYIIRIYSRDNANKLVQEWKYSEMPEIFSLKVGNYTAAAFSHDVLPAEFENPYYYGKEDFEITENQITNINTLQCVLRSIMVTVEYDEKLSALLGDDVKANVTSGEGSLDFVKDEKRAGYYQAINENANMLTTRLTGTIEGENVDISKGFPQIKAGSHKIIKYTLKDIDENGNTEGGNANISIRIDVTCTTIEQDIIVDPDEDVIPDEPDTPDEPDDPTGQQPTIKGDGFNISKAIVLPETTNVNNPYPVVVNIAASNGIANLKVTIDSDVLDEEALADVNLRKNFDLAYPEDLTEALTGLGFPVGEHVIGKTELVFSITKFTGLLTMLNPGTHNFIITVVDTQNNKTTETLTLIWSN
nr:DUF4493 domain-containing protein [uncultured Bacteroides sp.]